ncbi:ABC transporter ATP-binding protein [Rossellomorea vietnamensis]|uniref:ABC transporter ATP-binding protein n=1 Tax=Rossellomorea vietnamensis TaxID=218284 RepID=UPI0030849DD6|nr:ABC transporter ATP-binding protein [Rossellomorea vietnamensis]WQI97587.1 ABC transporter ATP-binding protein [Rossellomorea vietnamensis]WQI97599.1 ABC transporter ATP-binding protein [Rossellomorea vietnamensis]
MSILSITGVHKTYQSGQTTFQALTDIHVEVEEGEIVVILGPSGSGKSTLLNAIGGIDAIDSGSIVVNKKNIGRLSDRELVDYRREDVGFVFQMYNLIPNLTVYENIELTANISREAMPIPEVIHAVGLSGMEDRFPRELSGGQQQRVSIARAVVKAPKLLLCDEPTGALDSGTSKEILQLIEKVNKEFNTTVLIITHNQAIKSMANRVITLKDGKVESDFVNEYQTSAEGVEW